MSINETLRSLIRELLKDELEKCSVCGKAPCQCNPVKEVSASGAAGPYMTPNAFGKRKPPSGISKQEKPVPFGESRNNLSELSPEKHNQYQTKAGSAKTRHIQGYEHARTQEWEDHHWKKLSKRDDGIKKSRELMKKKDQTSWVTKTGRTAKRNADGSISYKYEDK